MQQGKCCHKVVVLEFAMLCRVKEEQALPVSWQVHVQHIFDEVEQTSLVLWILESNIEFHVVLVEVHINRETQLLCLVLVCTKELI